jgi:hypothetical protein
MALSFEVLLGLPGDSSRLRVEPSSKPRRRDASLPLTQPVAVQPLAAATGP